MRREQAEELDAAVTGRAEDPDPDGRGRHRGRLLHLRETMRAGPGRATRRGDVESTLGVLRPLARLVPPVLLALDLARIARDEARLLERPAQLRIRLHQRARDAVP